MTILNPVKLTVMINHYSHIEKLCFNVRQITEDLKPR